MAPPNAKEKIKEFQSITGDHVTESMATSYLESNQWNLERALDNFFNEPPPMPYRPAHSSSVVDVKKVEALFEKYKDPEGSIINVEGMEQFCQDLDCDPTDIIMLILSWQFNASTQCEFTKDEFVIGMKKLCCDSIDKLKASFPTLRSKLDTPQELKNLYIYSFKFARDTEKQTSLTTEIAVAMWKIIFQGRYNLDLWYQFLEEKKVKSVSKDSWTLFYDFLRAVDPHETWQLSKYDSEGAWPVLIDEFVEWAKKFPTLIS